MKEDTMHHALIDDYAARIARAIALIERTEPGDSPPTLAQLADAAAFSPFHFHRVFRLMTGETAGAAMRRIRLARSLGELTEGTRTITQASAGSGYATSQAFARAMRAAGGGSASDLRADPDVAQAMAHRLRSAPEPDSPLGIEIVSLDPFRVLAIRRDGPYEALNEGFDILFEQVFARIDMEALRGIWGVPLDDPFSVLPQARRFDCAIDVGDAQVDSSEIGAIQLGGGRMLSAQHTGSYDDVHAALDQLYLHALRANLALAEAPPLICYHDQPEEKPEAELRATLYLPVA
jgi:AraC family transcriptional regulator